MRRVNNTPLSTNPVIAVLGPTNTGKTHHALERMMSFDTGIMGFPLRLLARENYEKIIAKKGRHAVALVTGEEKIIPRTARYFLCTTESMPVDQSFEFLAVDEIQLASDPERGHIFTDRLLRARGTKETMFMGAGTMRHVLAALLPKMEFESRKRLSTLTYTGYKKLARLPKRTAIVGFSLEEVYNSAEALRRQRGGTAVVLGALSPRTRNAQVELYQSGEVEFMVATDAIGMGLNMDIHHVAFASTRKFDGTRVRNLSPAEMAQIAGRAGRYVKDGTFGVTGKVRDLDDDMVEAIEHHDFLNIKDLYWRNSDLDFSTPFALLKSLDRSSGSPLLIKGRPAEDYQTLQALNARPDVSTLVKDPAATRLLWDVCQVPDFRKTLSDAHQDLMAEIFKRLMQGPLDEDWVAGHVVKLDNTLGDVDTLSARIAHTRTWTYISFKSEWLRRAQYWQDKTRDIEDRLSDALHQALLHRFVDRRATILMRAAESGEQLLAGIKTNGEVIVEGHLIGHLHGFSFIPDDNVTGADAKTILSAGRLALKQEITRRITDMLTAKPTQFKLLDDGQIFYQAQESNPLPGQPIARIAKGAAALQPVAIVNDSELLAAQDKSAVRDHLNAWLKTHIKTILEPLVDLANLEDAAGSVRGIAFQVHEAMGIVPREQLEDLIAGLDPAMRQDLRNKKIRLGPVLVFIPALNKPAAVRLRALLWTLFREKPLPAETPRDGMVSFKIDGSIVDKDFYQSVGYPVYGPRAIRIDMLDRVINAIYESAKDGKFQAQHAMAEWLGCGIEELYEILDAMGHRKMQDPAPASLETASETQPAATVEQKLSEQKPSEEPAAEKSAAIDTADASKTPAQKPAAKPELAWFRLKKGKAFEKPKTYQKPQPADKPAYNKNAKKSGAPRRDEKPARPAPEPRVMSAQAKTKAESPFAILEQLKSRTK